jgi:hypothetical protein
MNSTLLTFADDDGDTRIARDIHIIIFYVSISEAVGGNNYQYSCLFLAFDSHYRPRGLRQPFTTNNNAYIALLLQLHLS